MQQPRGLAVMIISCPCALSLAIPLVITMGQANMVSRGIILRDPAALEAAAGVGAIARQDRHPDYGRTQREHGHAGGPMD